MAWPWAAAERMSERYLLLKLNWRPGGSRFKADTQLNDGEKIASREAHSETRVWPNASSAKKF
jgi:hypothetical protein